MTQAPLSTDSAARCANCDAPLHGSYCYSCGQPLKGMIRPLSGMMADVLDSVFNVDSRILRTLGPLFWRPGFLTTEYFQGRRVRYVTPFRLFFVMTLVAFFAVQTYMDRAGMDRAPIFIADGGDLRGAKTPEAVQAAVDKEIAELERAKAKDGIAAAAQAPLVIAQERIKESGRLRIQWLKEVEEAKNKGAPPPPEPGIDDGTMSFNGTPWNAKTNPLTFESLPESVNDKINDLIGNARKNLILAKSDPRRLVTGFFTVLPQTLFFLMPLFAVLLKFFYLFKRRLYMEHLIVALHSHAFIAMATLSLAILGHVRLSVTALDAPLGWLQFGISWWIPLYLLLMQKRVYRQGWIMTILKFGTIGICYTVLISLAIVFAALVSLAVT
ncbi:DUF3667 domain-containing protein [Tahibacter amnicola]|uniref:DUF3667 domain-containing protein n=1 Tax=Tahibacter amnicola TaxID=2976241 RepID=A0ABY6BGH2_9GAMM|nr:DUF3667 domain-containing protein [Tahibacter amnicola]UXI69124.1 DUF3667 domain-containing protein [Tahibacter amnicola]